MARGLRGSKGAEFQGWRGGFGFETSGGGMGVRNQEGRTGSQRRAEEQAGGNEQEQDTEKGAMESGKKRAESGLSGKCLLVIVTRRLQKGRKGSRSLRVGIPEAKNRSVPQERFWAATPLSTLGLHSSVSYFRP